MQLITGDARIFSADPGRVEISIDQGPHETITVDPRPEGMSWHDFTQRVCTPALREQGWRLCNWHRPRGESAEIANAFVWRAPD